jgi:dihydrofolate reductase
LTNHKRRLKLQMQMSLDGFVSTGPNDEQKWVTWAWDDIRSQVLGLFDSSDTILIGRKLAVDYIPYWQDVNSKPEDPMHEVAKRIVAAKKIVFSKSIKKPASLAGGSIWENTEVSNGDFVKKINELKNQDGKDLIVYGGTSFVAELVKAGLIDDYHIFINPVAIGKGESIFSCLEGFKNFKLKESIAYPSGIVLHSYENSN